MNARGRVHVTDNPFVPAADPADLRLRAPAARATTRAAAEPRTPRVLRALLVSGQIDQRTYDRALGDFKRARDLARRLSGARAAELRGVLADLESMAARGYVTRSRLPSLVATLEANIRWWTTGSLLGSGARVSFTGSQIVWQLYPGHGLQIQWLATWGKANGYYWADGRDAELAEIVAESISLAADRAGGIAFEYLFPFDGGSPPWVSGLAQGTALSALVRAGLRLHDATWYQAARNALGIFRVAPPEGVAQRTASGTHYLQYSFAPRLHIINGFVQSLNGLFDYAKVLDDPEGRQLFAAGRAEAAAELPRYDTGGWSKYSEYTDSSLHYHDVLRRFLSGLCTRLQRAGQSDEPFCKFAARFLLDMRRAPEITFDRRQATLRARRYARVRFSIDKPGTVTLVVRRGSFTHRAVVGVQSGRHAFGWRPPRAGTYSITISARDYAGNTATVSSSAGVRRR